MNVIRPVVGQWYRGGTNELFEVVAIDDQDQTIEIQYFDGTVTEVDFDSWNEQLLDELARAIIAERGAAAEQWDGVVSVRLDPADPGYASLVPQPLLFSAADTVIGPGCQVDGLSLRAPLPGLYSSVSVRNLILWCDTEADGRKDRDGTLDAALDHG